MVGNDVHVVTPAGQCLGHPIDPDWCSPRVRERTCRHHSNAERSAHLYPPRRPGGAGNSSLPKAHARQPGRDDPLGNPCGPYRTLCPQHGMPIPRSTTCTVTRKSMIPGALASICMALARTLAGSVLVVAMCRLGMPKNGILR